MFEICGEKKSSTSQKVGVNSNVKSLFFHWNMENSQGFLSIDSNNWELGAGAELQCAT